MLSCVPIFLSILCAMVPFAFEFAYLRVQCEILYETRSQDLLHYAQGIQQELLRHGKLVQVEKWHLRLMYGRKPRHDDTSTYRLYGAFSVSINER